MSSLLTQQAVASVGDADGVVIFSPTYRTSIPGVLKNLLDLTPVASLAERLRDAHLGPEPLAAKAW